MTGRTANGMNAAVHDSAHYRGVDYITVGNVPICPRSHLSTIYYVIRLWRKHIAQSKSGTQLDKENYVKEVKRNGI